MCVANLKEGDRLNHKTLCSDLCASVWQSNTWSQKLDNHLSISSKNVAFHPSILFCTHFLLHLTLLGSVGADPHQSGMKKRWQAGKVASRATEENIHTHSFTHQPENPDKCFLQHSYFWKDPEMLLLHLESSHTHNKDQEQSRACD